MKCRHAKSSELDKVCELLASEFYHDPVLNFAFTDTSPARRLETMKRFFRIYIDLARDYGGILLAEDNVGVLVYFHPELMEMTKEENERLDGLLRRECGVDYATASAFMNGLDQYHPRNPPHFYIFLVAVSRANRGGGIVKALFSKLNVILDKAKLPCYAECTAFSTRTLVRRFGYRDAGQPLQIEGFPELFPIWHEPNSIG